MSDMNELSRIIEGLSVIADLDNFLWDSSVPYSPPDTRVSISKFNISFLNITIYQRALRSAGADN